MTTSENLAVIRFHDDGPALWRAGQAKPQPLSANQEMPSAAVFGAPSEAIRCHVIDVAPDEQRHLAKSLPFMLEEEVVDDIDDLHFALQPLAEQRYLVAIVRREHMQQWQQALPPEWQGQWSPEALLLPWREDEVCCVVELDAVLVRWGAERAAKVPAALLSAVLTSIDAPKELVMYGSDREADLNLLPESLRGAAQWRNGNFAAALLLADSPSNLIDLRQREFAPQLPLARWWLAWRVPAIALAAALVLQMGADLAAYQRLKTENMSLRAAIQDSYRVANPRGAVVDAEKQLDRQIAEFNPAAVGTALTPMLGDVTRSIADDEGISISSMNFSASAAQMRLDILAADYAAIEQLRQRLGTRGYVATLETSSSRDQKVSARLRVEGGA